MVIEMSKKIKDRIRFTLDIFMIIAILMVALCLIFNNIDVKYSYVYKDNQINKYGWRYFIEIICGVLLFLTFIMIIAYSIYTIIFKVKHKEHIGIKSIIFTVLIIIVFCGSTWIYMLSALDFDYEPECFKFSDGQRKIVICEESFLLGGWANIYRIDNNKAFLLDRFTTDDGGRNHGNYELDWADDSVEIYYDNCTDSSTSKQSIIVFFN